MAKDNNNLCPVFVLAKTTAETEATRSRSARCREGRCNWWVDSENKCAILVIAEKP